VSVTKKSKGTDSGDSPKKFMQESQQKDPEVVKTQEISDTESENSEIEIQNSNQMHLTTDNRSRMKTDILTTKSDNSNEEASLGNLLKERDKINNFLINLNYYESKDCQTNKFDGKFVKDVATCEVATQRPTQEDIINEIVGTVDAKTVAQTQLNLLVETLETLKKEGVLAHLNISQDDLN
jgi:hypothetical protein